MTPGPVSRRSLLAASGALGVGGLLTGCGSEPSPEPDAGSPAPRRHRYGRDPSQVGDLYLPRTGRPRGTVVVVHGGFWRADYGLDLTAGVSADLAERGWAAWNVEYRRVGDGGGWPATFADLAAAIDRLASLEGAPSRRVVTLGHSAGGHLAVWAATRDARTPGGAPRVRTSAALSLAGVLDLSAAAEDGVGASAVPDLLGGSPQRLAGRYALASPAARLPVGVPVRCLHARDDDVVPVAQSERFVAAARTAGDDARLVEVPGGHFDVVDPATDAWARVVDALEPLA